MKQSLSAWLRRRLDFFTPRRTLRLGVGLSFAFILVVLVAARAEAQLPTSDEIANGVFTFLNTILFTVVQAVGEIVSLIVTLLVAVAQFNKFSTIRVVDIGWTIVKDVSNMLFIIALLVIAAGTVLRLENYRYNRLLSNLIIMAFLTNFSKFIAAFFIQGAQVLMLTFVNAFREALFGNFVGAFGLDKILQFSQTASTGDQGQIFGNMLAGLILIVIAMIITAAILVVLVVRIVALWILVILSPLAFALQILPNTKSFASRWWSEFGKYVIQGPILAFFLWLALAIVSVQSGAGNSVNDITSNIPAPQQNAAYFTSAVFDFNSLITFLISGAFLMYGLQYATSSSGVAGKWAGKVATAGFGAAATVSQLNNIRDRTIAPVQGWIKNRNAARQSAIQERTQTLEAAGDRVRASIPQAVIPRTNIGLTQAGREKAQAAADTYERQRTQRVAQSRGFDQMTTAQQQSIFQNSRDPRDRMAMLQVLQQQKKINLRDPFQSQALDKTLTDSRVAPEEKRKLRNQIMEENVGALESDQEVRNWLAKEKDADARVILGKELERRRALNADDAGDVDIINEVRRNLNGLPQRLKEFDDALKRSNPKMALETVYNGLKNGTADGQRLIADMQQGLMDGSALDAHTLATFHEALTTEAANKGFGKEQSTFIADSFMLRNITKSARTKADFDRIMNSFTGDAKRIVRNNAVLDSNTDSEKRTWVADTGAIEEAFTQIDNDGKRKLIDGLKDQYYSVNSKKIAENFVGGNMSSNTIKNDDTRTKIIALNEVDDDTIAKATKSEYVRKIFAEAQSKYVEGLDRSAAGWDESTKQGKLNNKQRMALAVGAHGDMVKDSTGAEVSSVEQAWGMSTAERLANPTTFATSQDLMGRFIRASGKHLEKLDFNSTTLSPESKDVIVNNINVSSLMQIHDLNPSSTSEIIKAVRAKEASIPTGDPDKKRWEDRVKAIDRNDTLSGLGT